MSGIFGLWRLDGRPVEPETLDRMSETLAHRGPDGSRTWIEGPVGLGYRLLTTTPEPLPERQPLVGGGVGLVLTADARIDNRDALISALGLQRTAEEITAADLLLAAYERWAERGVEHLIGDFAFAVWDARRRSLLCARDHFGVRPLYYFHAPGRLFAFASEIRALLTLAEVPDVINETQVARHLLVPLEEDRSATYYRHVRWLLPAHSLTVTDRGLEVRRYWQLDPTRELRLSSDEEYAEALREFLIEAVRCRFRSIAPLASMLSGGLDSSSITCVAARLLDEVGEKVALHTLSAVYPKVPESGDRSLIDEVLERHEVVPHFFEADTVSPIADSDRMNSLLGGACWGANLYVNWELYRVAASEGARVVLDGYGGDNIVSQGTAYLWELATSWRWLKLARVAIPYSRKRGGHSITVYRALVRYGLRHRLRGTLPETLTRRIRGAGRATPVQNRLTAPYELVINADFGRRFSNRVVSAPEEPVTERDSHAQKLNNRAFLEGLEWIEAYGAGRGVEVRFPFFDIRLAELCLSFPPDQKLRRGWSRFVMRRAMEGIVPPKILWSPVKSDLNLGWVHAYRSNENGRIEALLTDPRVSRYLNPEGLRALHARFMGGATSPPEENAMWRALSLGLWLIGRDAEQPPIRKALGSKTHARS